jgi:hypothetical protein
MSLHSFSDRTILVLPSYRSVANKDIEYFAKMREHIVRIYTKLPTLTAISSDETACHLRLEFLKWLQILPDEDMFFAKRNCLEVKWTPVNPVKLPILYDKLRERYPIPRGISTAKRFELLLRRQQWAMKHVLSNDKIILSVYTKITAPNALVIHIDSDNGDVHTYMREQEVSTEEVLKWF